MGGVLSLVGPVPRRWRAFSLKGIIFRLSPDASLALMFPRTAP